MTSITNIPLHQLTAWEGNVRKTQSKGFIDELAASIKAHGLQQNLVVRKDGRKFAVVAGGQRLKALKLLVADGEIKANHPVPCKVLDSDTEATELSLAENVVRSNMHPADQFEAFRGLVDNGMAIVEVAARFGVSETVVAQRLKLARVSPAILKTYRKGDLSLEQVMAFTVSDDHTAQERVLKDIAPWSEAGDIRAALNENDIAATDKRVTFVTLKAYEAAGGKLRRDLFSEDVFILDAELLDRLVREKLEKAAKPVRKEGWKWVEVRPEFPYAARGEFRRKHPELASLPPENAAQLEALQQEYEALEASWEAEEEAERPERLEELEEAIDRLQERDECWPADTLAIAGAVVSIGHSGKIDCDRGLVRPEDMPKGQTRRGTSAASSPEKAEGPSTGLSSALIEQLTASRSAALSAELLSRPDVGLAAIVHALASDILFDDGNSSLKIAATSQSFDRVEGSAAHVKLEAGHKEWLKQLPRASDALWNWCIEQKRDVLLALLAFCAAMTLDAVRKRQSHPDDERLAHVDMLGAALQLDVKNWFTPTAENYFSRISKVQILEALREARGAPPAPAWEKLKKAELATLAERELAGSGWLPALLRPAV